MRRRLPPLNSLKAFEAAARLGSFNQAAVELQVTHGAISRHVQLLEDWLGIELFRRLNRRVVLTDAGRGYLAEVGAALDRIALATAHHAGRAQAGVLRVSATATLALRWLIPRLSSFQLDNPAIEVRLTTSNDPIETLGETSDIAIRRCGSDAGGCIAIWSLSEYRLPVCSPKLLRRLPLRRLADLSWHTLLHAASRPNVWPDWLKAAGVPGLVARQSLVLEHNYQALQGALDGLGVALGSSALIGDDLAAGRLVSPFAGPKLPGDGYCAYVPRASANDPAVIRFGEWLARVGGTAGPGREAPPIQSSAGRVAAAERRARRARGDPR
jgi:LysR family transcriptional regulator, glycine cleavage system transcriptional activator